MNKDEKLSHRGDYITEHLRRYKVGKVRPIEEMWHTWPVDNLPDPDDDLGELSGESCNLDGEECESCQ